MHVVEAAAMHAAHFSLASNVRIVQTRHSIVAKQLYSLHNRQHGNFKEVLPTAAKGRLA